MALVRGRRVYVGELVRKDPVLAVALVLAAASCLVVPPDAGYLGYVDLRTIGMLFALMTIMTGLSRLGAFSAACRGLLAACRGPRRLCLALTLLAFFSSMVITNDVALVTFVPLGLLALGALGSERLTCFTVVMMTIAANLGSMFTPMGNPQNLYLYSVSHMALPEFMLLMLPYTVAALVMLAVAVLVFGRTPGAVPDPGAPAREGAPERISPARITPWALLFCCALLSVARIVPFPVTVAVVVAGALLLDRGALAHVDYGLLVTFVAFFVFVGNMGRIEVVHQAIAQVVGGNELAVSVAASQVLSNVPAAILLSGFTDTWPALIVGTNLGGLGTLIASMASLISYKQVALVLPRAKGRYLALFTSWNAAFLAVLLVMHLLLAR